LWQIPDKPIVVRLALDAVDGVLPEAMRTYASVPKRGAETGGVLIGRREQTPDGQTLVVVDQFEIVPCVYARGPSYLLSEEDGAAFERVCTKWARESTRPSYAVGYFRSHTRDGLGLSVEDIELLDRHFADPSHLALLIRPFASKPMQAGFFFRENGAFQKETPLPFIFSRKELAPGSTAEPGPTAQYEPEITAATESFIPAEWSAKRGSTNPEVALTAANPTLTATPGEKAADSAADQHAEPKQTPWWPWIWVPVSVLCLLAGMVAGVLVPEYLNVPFVRPGSEEFSLGLGVTGSDGGLAVHWNPAARAIRAAQRGTLEIEDGGYATPVDLDSAYLLSGSILYRNSSPSVRVRLVVTEGAGVTVAQTAEWAR
jgi:hypothetical protein